MRHLGSEQRMVSGACWLVVGWWDTIALVHQLRLWRQQYAYTVLNSEIGTVEDQKTIQAVQVHQ